jgi:hypothetical protein
MTNIDSPSLFRLNKPVIHTLEENSKTSAAQLI